MQTHKAVSYWLLAVLAHCLSCSIPRSHAETLSPKVYLKDSLPDQALGHTTCDSDGRSEIWIRTGLDSTGYHLVMLHELRHVRQLSSHIGGCKKAVEHYKSDPYYRLEIEVEAYAVQIWADSTVKADLKAETLVVVIWGLMRRYNFPKELTFNEVHDYILSKYGRQKPSP